MTDTILMQTLKKHGLERFDPDGDKFDPNLHDATFMTKMEGKEDGSVFEVIQKGFTLNGRVVRVSLPGPTSPFLYDLTDTISPGGKSWSGQEQLGSPSIQPLALMNSHCWHHFVYYPHSVRGLNAF